MLASVTVPLGRVAECLPSFAPLRQALCRRKPWVGIARDFRVYFVIRFLDELIRRGLRISEPGTVWHFAVESGRPYAVHGLRRAKTVRRLEASTRLPQ